MTETASFSETSVQGAIEAARSHYEGKRAVLETAAVGLDDGRLSILAECITLTIANGEVCINLPLGFGKACLPVPISYDGQVASVCLSICSAWGVPTGVRVAVSVAGVEIVSKTFGIC